MQFANFVLSAKLSIIHRCVQIKGIAVYYHKIAWYKFLSSWVTCPHQEIRILSRLIAGHVIPSCDDQMLSLLHFDEDDVMILLDLLHKRTSSKHFSVKRTDMFFTHQISALLRSINTLLTSQDCRSCTRIHLCDLAYNLVNDEQLVPSLTKVLSDGNLDERTQACHLLWNLLEHDDFKKRVTTFEKSVFLMQTLHKLSEDSLPELKCVCDCIVLFLKGSLHEGRFMSSYCMY